MPNYRRVYVEGRCYSYYKIGEREWWVAAKLLPTLRSTAIKLRDF